MHDESAEVQAGGGRLSGDFCVRSDLTKQVAQTRDDDLVLSNYPSQHLPYATQSSSTRK